MAHPTRRWALMVATIALLALDGSVSAQPAIPGPITEGGRRLAALLDGMNVEALWQHGYRIDWRTGVAESLLETTAGNHTHCSAFAAAVAERLGVYLLHPPEHGQNWLANAQERWLDSPHAVGWNRIGALADPGVSLRAVALANQGNLVVAVYFQPPEPGQELPGHIAVVRPSDKPPALIESEGPDVIQAGVHNHRLVALRIGFTSHPAAWSTGAIEFFWHDTNLA
jgi:hypothetical protein